MVGTSGGDGVDDVAEDGIPIERADEPDSLARRAVADLEYIRRTLEGAGTFTAMPGRGGVLMGALGLAGAVSASGAGSDDAWMAVWLVTAGLAAVVGVAAIERKARRVGLSLLRGPGRRFLMGALPPLGVGGVLTVVLWQRGLAPVLPGVWLLLYGASLMTGALFSLPLIRWMGLSFIAAGIGALCTPAAWGDAWMAAGFGGLNIAFGLWIARRLGG